MSKKFEKIVEAKLSEVEKYSYDFDWPKLKTWLESTYAMLSQSNGSPISNKHILRISKIFVYCLSPSLPDPLHKITIDLFEFLTSYVPIVQIVYLAYPIFPHVKNCTANNINDFMRIIGFLCQKLGNNTTLRNCIISCVLNGITEHGDRNLMLKQFIDTNLNSFPLMTEDLIWVFILQSRENQIPVLKILRTLKGFNSHPNLYVRAIVFALNHYNNRVKHAAFDAISDKININTQDPMFRDIVHLLLQEIFKFIDDKSILMRFDRWLPEDISDSACSLIICAVERSLQKDQKLASRAIYLIEKIISTERFDKLFLQKTSVMVIKCMQEYPDLIEKEYLKLFEKIYGKDNYRSVWIGFIDQLEIGVSESQNKYFLALKYALKNFKCEKKVMLKILNGLNDVAISIPPCHLVFDICLFLVAATETLPTNSHVLIEKFKEIRQLESFKSAFKSYIQYYSFIKSKFKGIQISLNLDPIVYNQANDFYYFLETVIENKFPLKTKAILSIWTQNYFPKETSYKVLLGTSYNEKAWIKAVISLIKSVEGLKNFIGFCSYYINSDSAKFKEIFRNSEIMSIIADNLEQNYERAPLLKHLLEFFNCHVSLTLDYILMQLALNLDYSLSDTLHRNIVIKNLDILGTLINKHLLLVLDSTEVSNELKYNVKNLIEPKFNCVTYLDLVLSAGFKYLCSKNISQDILSSAYELLGKISNLYNGKEIKKIVRISNLFLMTINSTGIQIYILRILLKIDLSLKISLNSEKFRKKIFKLLSTSVFSDRFLTLKNPDMYNISLSIFNSLAVWYLKENPTFVKKIMEFYMSALTNINYISLLPTFKELIFTLMLSGENTSFIPEVLFHGAITVFDIIVIAYKSCTAAFNGIEDIKEILKFLAEQCQSQFISGVITFWVQILKFNQEDIKIISDFFPCLYLTVSSIVNFLNEKFSERGNWLFNKEPEQEKNFRFLGMLNFLHSYLTFFEYEFEITKDDIKPLDKLFDFFSESQIEEILIMEISIFSLLIKKIMDIKLKDKMKITFQKSFENYVKATINSNKKHQKFPYPLVIVVRNAKASRLVSEALKSPRSYRLISSLFPDKKQRIEYLSSLFSNFIQVSGKAKYSYHCILEIFFQWVPLESSFYNKIQPSLIGISYTQNKFIEILNKFPKVCFQWGKLLNLCDSHSRLFKEFCGPFLPKSKLFDVNLQERARFLYISAFLVYTGKIDDYISPEIIQNFIEGVERLIDSDVFFSIACLALMILFVKLNSDDFLTIWRGVWYSLSCKFQEINDKKDVLMHSSMLKLIDILLVKGFSEISYLYFSNNIKYPSSNSRRRSILNDINPSNMEEIRTCTVALVKQFNEFHSECNEIDTISIDTSIENEFIRLKDLLF